MSTGLSSNGIARRVVQDIPDGAYVNLGIGMPMKVGEHLPEDKEIMLHTENGMLGMGPTPTDEKDYNWDLINAGKQPVSIMPGGSFFHHADSFVMIRGGHIDVSILGAYEIAENGDVANWMLPGPKPPAVGGAMDLAAGAKQVWVMLAAHVSKKDEPRILEKCTLPLTGVQCVTRIYSDLAVVDISADGLEVSAMVEGISESELEDMTGAKLHFRSGYETLVPREAAA